MTPAQHIATAIANEHLNLRCNHMDIQAKLLRWQVVYEAALDAMALYERIHQEQRRENLAYVSAN